MIICLHVGLIIENKNCTGGDPGVSLLLSGGNNGVPQPIKQKGHGMTTLHDTLYRLVQENPILFTYPTETIGAHPHISPYDTPTEKLQAEVDHTLAVYRGNFMNLDREVRVAIRDRFVSEYFFEEYHKTSQFPFIRTVRDHMNRIFGYTGIPMSLVLQARANCLGEWAGEATGSLKTFAGKYNLPIRTLQEAAEKGLLKTFTLEKGLGKYPATTAAAVRIFMQEHPDLCIPDGMEAHRATLHVKEIILKGGVLAVQPNLNMRVDRIVVENDTLMRVQIPKGAKIYGKDSVRS